MNSSGPFQSLSELTVDELICVALESSDLEEPSRATAALVALHERGSREVLVAAIELCNSRELPKRILGARILGELGGPGVHRGFPDECCDTLLRLAASDENMEVVIAAVFALGHLGNRRSDEALSDFSNHPHPLVRKGVAFALNGATSQRAVKALLVLMEDPDAEIRDWATTGIGMTVLIDGPEIRAALMRRSQDKDEFTRAEALHGLVRRRDNRVVPLLAKEIEKLSERTYLFEDAAKDWLGLDSQQHFDTGELITKLRSCEAFF